MASDRWSVASTVKWRLTSEDERLNILTARLQTRKVQPSTKPGESTGGPARLLVSSQCLVLTFRPYRCACRPPGGSLGSALRSTSGTCTHTWWSGWPATCHSPGRSTSPRSLRCHVTSCCRPAPQSPLTLRREREKERLSQPGKSV